MIAKRKSTRRRGGAVVETAVVAPLFLGMMLGMTEFGSAFLIRQTVTNAAREGARVGALPGATLSDVNAAVAETMASSNLQGYTVESNIGSLTANDTDVWVKVRLPFHRATFTGSMFGGGSINLEGKATMRLEGAAIDSGNIGLVP